MEGHRLLSHDHRGWGVQSGRRLVLPLASDTVGAQGQGSDRVLAQGIAGIAGQSAVGPDWTPVAAWIRDEATDDWNDQVAVDRLQAKAACLCEAEAGRSGPGRRRRADVAGAWASSSGSTSTAAARPARWPSCLRQLPAWAQRPRTGCTRSTASFLCAGTRYCCAFSATMRRIGTGKITRMRASSRRYLRVARWRQDARSGR